MTCDRFAEAIVARALDSLEPDEGAALETHVTACENCAEEGRRVAAFLERLRRAEGPAPAAGFAERVRARIAWEDSRPRGLLQVLRARLAESALLRIAASLLVLQLVGLPVLAAVLRIRAERRRPPEITIDPAPEPFVPDPVEPERSFVWPEGGGEGAADRPEALLGLRDRLRPVRRARAEALASEGRAERILARGGAPWIESELGRALDRLGSDADAFTRPERAPLTLLALLWTEPRPGRGLRASAILDLADRIRPHAEAGDVVAAFALWEGLLADAVPIRDPGRCLALLPASLQGLEAALAARMGAEALEIEVLESPLPLVAAASLRAGFPEEGWIGEGLVRFAREEVSPSRPPSGRPSLEIEEAFAMRGFVATDGRAPAAFLEALEAARRDGALDRMPPERAVLLLASYLAPAR